MQRVIVTDGGVDYPYDLIHLEGDVGVIRNNDGEEHTIGFDGRFWQILDVSYPHEIRFYSANPPEYPTCRNEYFKYKQICGGLWDLKILPGLPRKEYLELIDELLECIEGRLKYSYTCRGGLDISHHGAINKIESKVVLARLYSVDPVMVWNQSYILEILSEQPEFVQRYSLLSSAELVNLIVRHPLNRIHQIYKQWISLRRSIGKQELLALLVKLTFPD